MVFDVCKLNMIVQTVIYLREIACSTSESTIVNKVELNIKIIQHHFACIK